MPAGDLRSATRRPAALATMAAAALGATALGASTPMVEPAAAAAGPNLVGTSSFEKGSAGWRAEAGRVTLRTTEAAPVGTSVARVHRGKGKGNYSLKLGYRSRPATEDGAAYVGRAWVRAGRRHTAGKPITMALSLRNANHQRVKHWTTTRPLARAFRQIAVTSGRVPAGHTLSLRLVQGDAVAADRYEVDGVSLTKRTLKARSGAAKRLGAPLRRAAAPAPPPPAPAPAPKPVFDPSAYSFNGDYETGDLSQWWQANHVESLTPKRIQVVSDIVRQGRYAGRFEVRPGDKASPGNDFSASASGERAENSRHWAGDEVEGQSFYYSFSMYLPPDWIQEQDGYRIPLQFHSVNRELGGRSPSPPVNLDFLPRAGRPNGQGAGGFYLEVSGGNAAGDVQHTKAPILPLPIQTGVWHDFVIYINWHRSSGDVKIWHKTADQAAYALRTEVTDRPTVLYINEAPTHVFMRQGLYRKDNTAGQTNVIYLDAMTRSGSFEAAAAAMP